MAKIKILILPSFGKDVEQLDLLYYLCQCKLIQLFWELFGIIK